MSNRSSGALVISIDLDSQRGSFERTVGSGLERAIVRVLETLSRHGVAATWAVAEPGAAPVMSRLLSNSIPQEMAILGDRTWVGATAGRARFLSELVRRTTAARIMGLNVSTLALRDVSLADHLDLVLKQGLSAIRGDASGAVMGRRGAVPQPRALHYGLWELPVTCRLPAGRGWFANLGISGKIRRQIEASIAGNATTHLLIDGAAFFASPEANLGALDKILRHAATRRDQGQLSILTVGQAADKLIGRKSARPARSILRKAA